MKNATQLIAAFIIVHYVGICSSSAQSTCTVSVNTALVINPNAKKLLGLSFDGRSSADFNASAAVDPVGYHDPATGGVDQPLWNRMPMGGVRYPGNLVTYNWNWSYTIGPFAGRIAQPMGPGGSLPQKLQFGFDEFMDMVQGKNLSTSDVQIMVNIYPSVGQPNPAILAADWVEYCNAALGTNPRGGTDWAALRALYGREQPYGIRIWNIGNEPWTGAEFGSTTTADVDDYMAVALPIIDSMLAVDPSINITIPAVGNGSSVWNAEIMNPNAPYPFVNKIYGLSPHAFYDADASTTNPSPSQAITLLTNLATVANNKGLSIVAGDHAHFAPNADPDKAMRWEGALASCDFLLGISQISNIELANFWIFGNTKAVWHPIRENANGTYTFMALAQLYEALFPYFYDQSLSSSIVNAVGGAAVPNTRVAAFKSSDNSAASVIVVNTHLSNDNEIIPPVLGGLSLHAVKLLTASSVNQDTFMTTQVSALPNGRFASPHTSILIFEFSSTPLSVEFAEPIRAYQTGGAIQIEWATLWEENCERFEIERSQDASNFKKINTVSGHGNDLNSHVYKSKDQTPFNGTNYYRIKQIDFDGDFIYSRIVAAKYQNWDVDFYPNPTSGTLYFSCGELIDKIEVLNNLGCVAKVFEKPLDYIDMTEFPQGFYFLNFYKNDGTFLIKKIIKNR